MRTHAWNEEKRLGVSAFSSAFPHAMGVDPFWANAWMWRVACLLVVIWPPKFRKKKKGCLFKGKTYLESWRKLGGRLEGSASARNNSAFRGNDPCTLGEWSMWEEALRFSKRRLSTFPGSSISAIFLLSLSFGYEIWNSAIRIVPLRFMLESWSLRVG